VSEFRVYAASALRIAIFVCITAVVFRPSRLLLRPAVTCGMFFGVIPVPE